MIRAPFAVSIAVGVLGGYLFAGCASLPSPPPDQIANPLAEASSTSAPTGAASETEGTRALPKEPDRDQTRVAVTRGVRTAQECSKTHPTGPFGQGTLSVALSNKGKLADVQIPPPFAGTEMAKCIEQAFAHEIIPPWDGPDGKVDVPLTLKKQK